jgi:hypothetical protein
MKPLKLVLISDEVEHGILESNFLTYLSSFHYLGCTAGGKLRIVRRNADGSFQTSIYCPSRNIAQGLLPSQDVIFIRED